MSKIINGEARVTDASSDRPAGKIKISKFLRSIFTGSDDIRSIADYLIDDVFVPQVQKTLADMGKSALDRLIYKDKSPASTSRVEPIGYSTIFTNKTKVSTNTSKPRFGTLILDNVDDCKMLLNNMQAIIDRNGIVTVLQLYDMAGHNTDVYTAQKYGWTNIDSAKIIKTDEGWRLDMPIPMMLD